MIYAYDISDDSGTIVNSEAYSPDELGEAITEALSDAGEGDFTIEVEVFSEGEKGYK